MNFFNRLERKLGRYAIPDLSRYIVGMYMIGLLIQMIGPEIYYRYLCLNGAALLRGQVWRIVTFMFYPLFSLNSRFDVFGVILNMLIGLTYYRLGSSLENVWGAFRFNVYFLLGIIGHVAGAIIIALITGFSVMITPVFLNFSLFMAFALTFPDIQLYIWGLIPVKVKYLAIAEGAIYLYLFITGGLVYRLEIGLSLLNVAVFFLTTRNFQRYSPKEVKRRREFRTQVKIRPAGQVRHRCAVCGRTEEDGPQMEFRFCSKCVGSYEYCQDHLYTHKHVTTEGMPPTADKFTGNPLDFPHKENEN